jgi:hypothetical protein
MISKEIKLTCPTTIEDRIQRIRGEINTIIDARAAAVAKESPGVPLAGFASVTSNLVVSFYFAKRGFENVARIIKR